MREIHPRLAKLAKLSVGEMPRSLGLGSGGRREADWSDFEAGKAFDSFGRSSLLDLKPASHDLRRSVVEAVLELKLEMELEQEPEGGMDSLNFEGCCGVSSFFGGIKSVVSSSKPELNVGTSKDGMEGRSLSR